MFSVVLLFLLIVSITIQPVFAQGSFSDNFSGSFINPVWKSSNDQGVSEIQVNGVLQANETYLGASWVGATLFKPIDSSVTSVAADYSYNVPVGGMGQIYLEGRDSSNTQYLWIVGEAYGGGVHPVIMIYEQGTTGAVHANVTSSWNMVGASNVEYTSNSGGSGQIFVQFLSSNQINVVFSFPTTTGGINSITKTFTVAGSTKNIDLVFNYPPLGYYGSSDCLLFDNYGENGPQSSQMSEYCTVTTINNVNNNPSTSQVLYQGLNNPSGFNVSVLIIVGLSGIGVIGIISIIYNKNRRMNLKRNNFNPTTSQTSTTVVNMAKHLCVNCHAKIDPSDRFCSNCGNPIIVIK